MHCNHFRKPETTAIAAIKAAIKLNVDVQDAESFKRMQDSSLSPPPRTAPRLHSSDDGLFLAKSTLRDLKKTCSIWRFLRTRCQSRGSTTSGQYPVSEHRKGPIISKGELIEKVLRSEANARDRALNRAGGNGHGLGCATSATGHSRRFGPPPMTFRSFSLGGQFPGWLPCLKSATCRLADYRKST